MRIVCDNCDETVEVASFQVEGDQVVFACPLCRFDHQLDNGAGQNRDAGTEEPVLEPATDLEEPEHDAEVQTATALSLFDEPATAEEEDRSVFLCPKCFHTNEDNDHCHKCGLDLTDVVSSEKDWDASPEGRETEFARATELWAAVEDSIGADSKHEEFISYCTQNQLLETAVRRYRRRQASYPEEKTTREYFEVVAERMQNVAISSLTAASWNDDVKRRVKRAKSVILAIAVLLLVVGIIMLILMWEKTSTSLPAAM